MKPLTILILCNNLFLAYMMVRIDKDSFSCGYTITSGNRCQDGVDRFGFYQGLPITDCVVQCALRPHCNALSYYRHINVCELYLSQGNDDTYKEGNCLFVRKSDIKNIQTPCEQCLYGKVCDVTSKTCRYKECVNVTIPTNGTVLGNLCGLNDVIRYVCDVGYQARNGNITARCLNNGQWSGTVECARVCREPKIDNAFITTGNTFEGSVRNVTCVHTTIDDYKSTFEIQCMEDGSWKPEITCLKNVIFRVITGNGYSTSSAWKNGQGSTSDVNCRAISNTNCTGHYRDPRIDQWSTFNVQKIRYSIIKNFKEVAWIEFNGMNSDYMNWFETSRILNSSYPDISSSSTFNFLQIEVNVQKRRFYSSVSFHGCNDDVLYFVTIDNWGDCWYDQTKPFPSIFYSNLPTMANTGNKDDFDFGDTAVVSFH